MIPAPNAEFLAAESLQIGSDPVFTFEIWPYYFANGLGEGAGTFSNCAFVSPDRIEVDYAATTASWTSPEIVANMNSWPVSLAVAWTSNPTGYSLAVQYRTASTSEDLADATWLDLTNGADYDFYQYYQIRCTWIGIRSFAFDSPEYVNPLAAFAVDSLPDDWASYATDGVSVTAYLENIGLSGVFTIPDSDILDAGEFMLEAPGDFSDLVAGDHTLRLINPNDPLDPTRIGRYSPGHANFIFANDASWYLKNISIYFGYRRPGSVLVDDILLYEGVIMSWGPVDHKISADGRMMEHVCEIYSRNKISYLLDCQLGLPDQDGKPNPVVYGVAFQQADQLAGEMVGNPQKTAYGEDNNTAEFDHTFTNNGGTFQVSSSNPAAGSYCFRATTAAQNTSYGIGVIELPANTDRLLFACRFCFNDYPASPLYGNTRFITIVGNAFSIYFYVGSNGRVFYTNGSAAEDTDWYIDDFANSWRTLAVGVQSNTSSGLIKVWIDGNEIYSFSGSLSGGFNSVIVGPIVSVGEIFDISFDDLEIWNNWYPEMYRIPGLPYSDIEAVYIDGSLRVQKAGIGIVSRIISGRKPNVDSIDQHPAEGVVVFTDPDNLPSGTVTIRARKNEQQHPVDIIAEVLTLANCDSYIDTASFAAAKEAIPDDIINLYAEETSAGDILREIASSCLILIWMDQDVIKLLPYLGQATTSSAATLAENEIMEISEQVSMENIRNKVTVKWGWYERNKKLYYECTDSSLGTQVGDLTEALDLSWGTVVTSESQMMARQKADRLLLRLAGGVSKLNLKGPMSWARLEIGDVVTIDSPFIRNNEVYIIYSKTLRCSPPYGVDLAAVKFLGESTGD
jgi:hypothetical protein